MKSDAVWSPEQHVGPLNVCLNMTSLPEWVVANVAANPNTLLYLLITNAFIGFVWNVVKLIQLLHPRVEVIQFYRNLFVFGFRRESGRS